MTANGGPCFRGNMAPLFVNSLPQAKGQVAGDPLGNEQ